MRRTVLVLAVLVVVGILAWLAFLRPEVGSGVSSSSAAETTPAAAKSRPADLEAPAHAPEERVANAVEPADTTLRAEAIPDGNARLAVRVVNRETKEPLAGWRVRVMPKVLPADGWNSKHADGPRGTMHAVPITDGEGRAWIDCVAGQALEVSAWSEATDDRGQGPSADVEALAPGIERAIVLEVRYESDLVLYVRALDAEHRAPLPGVRVRVLQSGGWVRTTGTEAPKDPVVLSEERTGADGLCRLELRSWTRPHLELESGERGRTLSPAPPGHETPATALEVTLLRAAALRGELVGATGGHVRLRAHAYEMLPSDQRGMLMYVDADDPAWTAEVGPDARFVFDALPAGCELRAEYLPLAAKPQLLGESLRLSAGESRSVTWRLEGRCAIRGRVVDGAGSAVGGVVLWLVAEQSPHPHVFEEYSDHERLAATTGTDAAGAFEFSDVRPGAWQVGLAPQGPGEARASDCAGLSERVTVAPEDTLREVVLRVDRGLYVEGLVVTPLGLPADQAFIHLIGLGSHRFHGENVKKGAFRAGPLVRGRYQVSATGRGHGPSPIVEVEAGAKDVVLRLTPGATIEGRVIDDSGVTGRFEIKLVAAPGSKIRFSMMATTTQEDGTFSLEGLEPATYEIVASSSGGRYGVRRGIEVTSGRTTSGVDIRLGAGARLRVKSSFAEGSIFVRCGGTLIHTLQPDKSGPVECALPPGSIQVELARWRQVDGEWGTETLAEKSLELLPGEVKELELEAPK